MAAYAVHFTSTDSPRVGSDDHLKSLPQMAPDKEIAPDARSGSATPGKVTLRMGSRWGQRYRVDDIVH